MRLSPLAFALLSAGLGRAYAAPLKNGGAWVEAHLASSEARLTVDRHAHAAIDLTLGYRVVAGTLHSVEIAGAHFDALEPSCEVRAEDGSAQIAGVLRKNDGATSDDVVELAFEGKGLRRGSYTVHLKGGIALAPVADGVMWRVQWSSPITNEGLDGARIVFDLPAAPTEPRAIRADAAPGEIDEREAHFQGGLLDPLAGSPPGIVPTLRRNPQRDDLELVRPHVARGEGATWTVRVDPKAFEIPHPALKPTVRAPSVPPMIAPARAPLAVVLGAVGLVFAAIVLAKARAARAIGARPLVPVSWLFAGIAMTGAVWLETVRQPTEAALAVAFAMVFSTFVPRARAERLIPNDLFDATRATGAAVLCTSVIALVILARLLSAVDPLAPIWTALDAAVLVPLFFTGIRPAPGPVAATAILQDVSRRHPDIKMLLVERSGELRLHLHPAAPLPGLNGLEVAVRWDRSGSGFAPALEILARVRAESAAHARLLGAREPAPAKREPGRKPDERVFRYAPEDFDAVLKSVFAILEERRTKSVRPGVERRKSDSRLSSAPDGAPAH